jgi:cell division protein FtsW
LSAVTETAEPDKGASQTHAFSRTDRSSFGVWWWTVDHWLLGATLALIGLGVLLSFGSSPAAAQRLEIAFPFHFAVRQSIYAVGGVVVLLVVSMLPPRGVRRTAFVVYLVAIAMMAGLIFLGHSAKGATRWVEIAGFTLQPSEFMKPALIVLVAWMFSEGQKGEGVPGVSIAFFLYILAVGLLIVEPDVGQTVLITVAFGAAFWMAGVPMSWVMALGGVAVAGLASTYFLFQHVASRVDRFFSHDKTLDTHQVDRAAQAIAAGGLFGRGPGEGIMKREVPDMHTDFIYSASAEEYGLWFSLILIALFMFLTLRGLFKALRLSDPFEQVAAAGLFVLVGMQAFINVAVNLNLMPTKGMTLPFISYGGSSMLAMGLTMGMALALTRRRAPMRRAAASPRPAPLPDNAAPGGGKLAVVAAGGTGGHLFPAQALAQALVARGWRVVLATDERVQTLSASFPAEERIPLSAATFKPGDPLGMVRAVLAIFKGVMQARAALKRLKPAVVVGFGGYPSLPALIAAISQGRRTVIHEQNAVMGRANRLLAARVSVIACAFPTLQKAPASVQARGVVVGNPVRPEIRGLYERPYEAPTDEVRLLVTGGSQGARLLSLGVPEAIARLPEPIRKRLKVQQQTRAENIEAARKLYQDAGVEAEIAPFFSDMAERLGSAHLMIGRAGASTVCEIAVAGRPSILVPLKIALDDDQGQNARLLSEAGGAEILREDAFSPESLAALLQSLIEAPDRLQAMAAAAHAAARPDAADRLADVVQATAAN